MRRNRRGLVHLVLVFLALGANPVHAGNRYVKESCPKDRRALGEEVLRLLLLGGNDSGIERNPCLKSNLSLTQWIRVPQVSRSEDPPREEIVRVSSSSKVFITGVHPLGVDSWELKFKIKTIEGVEYNDSFKLLDQMSFKVSRYLGCAEVLRMPQKVYRISPTKGQACPRIEIEPASAP